MTASADECAISGKVARRLAGPVRADVLDQAAQRAEDLAVFLGVGAQLHAVALGDDECYFQNIDRIQPQALPVQGLIGVERGRGYVKVQRLDDESGHLTREVSLEGGGGRLLQGRYFFGHGIPRYRYTGSHYTRARARRRRAISSGRRSAKPTNSRRYMEVRSTLS